MDAATTAKRKRKRPATATTREATASSAAAVEEASDAEVEEFYAILRRMRDASRRLCGAAGASPPARAQPWRPSFSWEDFAPAPPRPDDDERVANREDSAAPPRAGLDLNVEPEPDTPSSASVHHALGARPGVARARNRR
jgi:hypothetical protein